LVHWEPQGIVRTTSGIANGGSLERALCAVPLDYSIYVRRKLFMMSGLHGAFGITAWQRYNLRVGSIRHLRRRGM